MEALIVFMFALPFVLMGVMLYSKHKASKKPKEKQVATLITVGTKPGLYVRGLFETTIDDNDALYLADEYIIYNFWDSPESHYYNADFFLSVNATIEDAVLDIPEPTRTAYKVKHGIA